MSVELVVDNTRRRRQVAAPQATIARTARVARSLGPEWQVLIEGNVVRLFQGPAPIAMPEPYAMTSAVRDFSL
jgi:hypothetical protein